MKSFEPSLPPLFDGFHSRRTAGQRARARAHRRAVLSQSALTRAARVKARLLGGRGGSAV
jgi:hypothetical protein